MVSTVNSDSRATATRKGKVQKWVMRSANITSYDLKAVRKDEHQGGKAGNDRTKNAETFIASDDDGHDKG